MLYFCWYYNNHMSTQIDLKKNHLQVTDFLAALLTCAVSGFLLKIPEWFNLPFSEDLYFEKLGPWSVIFCATLYLLLRGDVTKTSNKVLSLLCFMIPGLYLFAITPVQNSQSIPLAYFHAPLVLGCFYGISFMDFHLRNPEKRIEFIRYLGDLICISAIILLAGGLFMFLSIVLFQSIGIKVEHFYMNYLAIWGLGSTPILATFVIKNVPALKNKLAPMVATIFSPIVLLTLVIFLIGIPTSNKSICLDRSFLMAFNLMLLGVMALIVYSASGFISFERNRFKEVILLFLVFTAIVVDAYALYAIGFRIEFFGITPNKLAVLLSNLIIFIHLIWILIDLIGVVANKKTTESVLKTVSKYIPVYFFYALFMMFVLPLLFSMR
jgi:hypothetical protein